MGRGPKSYKDAGVDIHAGDSASRLMFEASKRTWRNREASFGQVRLTHESFSSLRFLSTEQFPGAVFGMNFDGVGTKIEIAERVGDHTTIAYDLFAMVCDDAARTGGEPVAVGSILDFNRVSISVVTQLAHGMVEAARIACVAVINGEIAELGARVSGYGEAAYNWGAAAIWFGRHDRLLTGQEITPGDGIVALRERGLRSNGISLVRAVLATAYGEGWHEEQFGESTLGLAALAPSAIYTPALTRLNGGLSATPAARVHGVAHVTGGGIPGKLGRLLAETGCGATLDQLFPPCELMSHCQSLSRITDEEAYKAWNMGNGLLIITPDVERVVSEVAASGYDAQVAGKVDAEPGIRIRNMAAGAGQTPWLSFRM